MTVLNPKYPRLSSRDTIMNYFPRIKCVLCNMVPNEKEGRMLQVSIEVTYGLVVPPRRWLCHYILFFS